jgi:hypothetical protein
MASINAFLFGSYTSCGSYEPYYNNMTINSNNMTINNNSTTNIITESNIFMTNNQSYYISTLYGSLDSFNNTQNCILNNFNPLKFGTCYCVVDPIRYGDYCGQYNLRYASTTCNGLLTTYTRLLTSSAVFCSLIFFFGLILTIITFRILLIGAASKPPEAVGHLKWLSDTVNINNQDDTDINDNEFMVGHLKQLSDNVSINNQGDTNINSNELGIVMPIVVKE